MQIVQGLEDHCEDLGFYFDQHGKLLSREIVFHEFLALPHILLSLPRMQGPDHLCHLLLHNRLLQNRGLKQQTFIF